MRQFVFGCSLALLLCAPLQAQSFTTGPCDGDEGNTRNNNLFFGHKEQVCQLRKTTLPAANGQVHVSGKNGGIEVVGEDRHDIALEARVIVQDSNRERAESLQHEVKIITNGTIRAEGPSMSGWFGASWSVNFRLHVPRRVAAELSTENGGISITDVDGEIHAETTNGGLSLHHLAGKVHATTVNGGVDVILDGDRWQGGGLFARSTNGGVTVKAPDPYSAHVIAETVNGGISLDFPTTVRSSSGSRNHLETDIGQGGPTIEFQTVNGGVSIHKDKVI